MKRGILVAVFVAIMAINPAAATEAERVAEPSGEVTLQAAIGLVLLGNPELQAYSHDVRAAEALSLQGSLRPNPTAALDVEDFGGTLGFANPELTLSLAQLVELGGKRRARIAVADAEASVAQLDYEATRLMLLSQTQQRFLEGLALQHIERLSHEAVRIAEETVGIVRLKVRSGVTSPAELTRAEVELSRARLDQTVLAEQVALSRSRVSALWGSPVASFSSFAGRLDSLIAIPNRDSLLARVPRSQELLRWEAELRAREAEIALANAEATPDLEIMAGYRARLETDDHAFVAGLALPLPLFSRHQGRKVATRAASDATQSRRTLADQSRRLQIVEAHSNLAQDRIRIATLQEQVIPGAARAFSELQIGYQRGRFSYLDLLEARRTWTEAQREEVMALLDFHQTIADLERLLGEPIAQGGRER